MKKYLLPFGMLLLLLACSEPATFDESVERAKIIALHQAQRDYHFNKDSIAFVNQFSDNFISVNKGVISHPKKAESVARFHQYFSSVEFLQWDDVTEPIIRFSADRSLAYTIVDKIVTVNYPDENGNPYKSETHFAWTAIYKKYDGEWKIDCVTSTERPAL